MYSEETRAIFALYCQTYCQVLQGERPSSLTDEKIIDLVTAIHVVEYAEDKWADNGER